MRGKPRSYSDLPTEEREQIDPHIHNNPPKILHPLNLVSPSLKIDHNTVQRTLRLILCLVGSYLLLLGRQSVERSAVFFVLYKRTDAQPKKIGRPETKKRGGGGKKKTAARQRKKIAPPKTKI